MMRPSHKIHFDVASAISQGRRDYQEDAIITDFPMGSDLGFAVLADGMGGHASGDVASKIVVTEVFSELKLQSGNQNAFEENVTNILLDAALAANECVNGHVSINPDSAGMGATLIAPVFLKDRLYWISIGDSPLFLYRSGKLAQLNEDHSMAPQIDYMVETGQLEEETAKNHPDRNCLTSVLIGETIARIDCPQEPVDLNDGDILIMASDGLQFLSNAQIETALAKCKSKSSTEISELLMEALEELGDPDQDNISFSVIKIRISGPQISGQQKNGLGAHSALETTVASNNSQSVGAAIASAGQSVMTALRTLRSSSSTSDGAS